MDIRDVLRRLSIRQVTEREAALAELGLEALPALREVLRSGNATIRARAAEALRQSGAPGLDMLREALLANEAPNEVALALGQAGPDGVRALRAGLRHARPTVRLASIAGLVEAGPDAIPAIPALSAALADRYSRVRLAAADAIGTLALQNAIGAHARVIIPALVILLDDRTEIAEAAAGTLAALGEAALPTLLDALEADEDTLRIGAAMALALMNNPALLVEAVPALRAALRDPLDEVRYWSALALADAQAHEALIDLEQAAATETDAHARQAMQEAIERLRQP